jgi:hypothetical protein
MAQFQLNWFNAAVLVNANALVQRASYRQKSVGGSFITAGFTPANDLPKTAVTTTSPVLAENVIWEFNTECICTVSGPTINDNGLIEKLKFQCLTPILSNEETTAQAVLNITGLDITKARFTLHLDADDTVAYGPVIVNAVGNSITANATGLDPETEYYWEIELYATVGGVEIISSAVGQLGASCISATFETDADICEPCTAITATVIEA